MVMGLLQSVGQGAEDLARGAGGLLQSTAQGVGNAYFGPGAFGDPMETARTYAPPGMLENLPEEDVERMGQNVQSQLRNPWMSRSGIREDFQDQVVTAAKQRADESRAEAMQGLLQGPGNQGSGLLGPTPQQPAQGQPQQRQAPQMPVQGMSMFQPGTQQAAANAQAQQPAQAAQQPQQQAPWQPLVQTGMRLMQGGFAEEGQRYIEEAERVSKLPNWEQQQQEMDRFNSAYEGIATAQENGDITPLQAQTMRALPADQLFEAVGELPQRTLDQRGVEADAQSRQAVDTLVERGDISRERGNQILSLPQAERFDALYGTTNLSPGSAMVGPQGGLITERPTANQQDEAAGLLGGPDGDAQEVARIMEANSGLSEDEAWNIALGVADIRQDPVTGRNFITNIATGTQRPFESESGQPEVPEGEAYLTPSSYDLSSTLGLTGAWRRPINAVSDFFSGDAPFQDTQRTNNALNQLQFDVTSLLADNMTGRVSQQTLDLIREGFTVDPNALVSGRSAATEKLTTTRNNLQRLAEQEAAKLQDPYAYPQSEVADARNTVQQLANRVADINVLLDSAGTQQTPDPGQQGGQDDDLDSLLNQYAP